MSSRKSTTTPDHPLLTRDNSIEDFCQRRGWSRSFFYKEKAAGRAPRVTKSGRKSTIRGPDEIAWDLARAEAAQ